MDCKNTAVDESGCSVIIVNTCLCVCRSKAKCRGGSGGPKPGGGVPVSGAGASSGGPGIMNKHSKGEKGDKPEKDKSRHSRGAAPFHRRSSRPMDEMYQHDMDYMMTQGPPPPCGGAGVYNSPPSYKTSPGASGAGQPSSAPSGGSLPQLPNTSSGCGVGFGSHGGGSGGGGGGGVDSPHSGEAPSPLVALQIGSVAQMGGGDPTMPTLSPHPPSKNADKDLNTSGHMASESQDLNSTGNSAASAVASANNSMSSAPGGSGGAAPADSFVSGSKGGRSSGNSSHKPGDVMGSPPYQNGLQDSHTTVKVEGITTWLNSQLDKQAYPLALKRPALPVNGYDQANSELVTESLYNFDSLNAWSVKVFAFFSFVSASTMVCNCLWFSI